MTVAEWCIFGAVILYLLTIAPFKAVGFARSFDNSKPRDPDFYDQPLRSRALGAHQNGIETFPFFAAAVLLAEFRNAPQSLINELAVLFVIVRVAYVLTYIGNRPTLRSILWNIGFVINLAIFFLPLLRQLAGCLAVRGRSPARPRYSRTAGPRRTAAPAPPRRIRCRA